MGFFRSFFDALRDEFNESPESESEDFDPYTDNDLMDTEFTCSRCGCRTTADEATIIFGNSYPDLDYFDVGYEREELCGNCAVEDMDRKMQGEGY